MQAARIILIILIALVPWLIPILGRSIPSLQPSDDAGKCVKFVPDKWMYAFGWTFLCACLSASWILVSLKSNLVDFALQAVMFFLIVGGCLVWMWRYPIHKKDGISVFLMILFVLVMLLPVAFKNSVYGMALLLPLLVWVIFQLVVSMRELECASA